MIYTISIDWLSVYCLYMPDTPSPDDAAPADEHRPVRYWEPAEYDAEDLFGAYPWRCKLENFGTRQFSKLYRIAIPNEEGGWDDFAEVQAEPHANILVSNAIIVRFVNRTLYRHDFWELANKFLMDNHLEFKNISRIDICADFNQFRDRTPISLIEDFAAKRLRHVGQGVGAMYFNHGIMPVDGNKAVRDYGVKYTGLSFGTHKSDVRVYLYNKSFELLTQGNKPWIVDRWNEIGLDITAVWRLEVSIKAKGCKFKDKITGKKVDISKDVAADGDELAKIYHTFVQKRFAFVKNRKHITNITREPRIQLFDMHPIYAHKSLRNVSSGNRMEKILIKALYQLGDLYRGGEVRDDALLAQQFAYDLANSCDLSRWMGDKITEWDKPTHK